MKIQRFQKEFKTKMHSRKILMILSVIIGVMFGWQHIILSIKNDGLYNPLPVKNSSLYHVEELAYAANVNQAINGNYLALNAHIKGKGDVSNSIEIVPNIFLGIFAKLFSISINNLIIISDFILPVILFLLYFYICHKLYGLNETLSIFVSLFVLLFVHDIALFDIAKNILTFNLQYFVDFFQNRAMFSVTRFMHPEFTLVLMLLTLAFLYHSFSKKGIFYPIITGVMAGSLAYSYFYYWTFFWATFFAFSLLMVLTNRDRQTLTKVFITGVSGIFLSAPYIIRAIKYSLLPHNSDLLLRIGASFGKAINVSSIIASIILLVLLYLSSYEKGKRFYFICATILASPILLNLQLLTGYTVQFEHWLFRIINPLWMIAGAMIFYNFYHKINISRFIAYRIFKLLGIFGIAALFIFGFYIQSIIAFSQYPKYKADKRELLLYDWLNKHTPKDSTIMTISIEQNIKIQAYTHNTIYLPNAMLNSLTTDEIVDRWLYSYELFNVSDTNFLKKLFLTSDSNLLADFEDRNFAYYLFHFQFDFWDRNLTNKEESKHSTAFPKEFRDYALAKKNSKNYKIFNYDYVLLDPYSEEIAETSHIRKNLRQVYSDGSFSLYAK